MPQTTMQLDPNAGLEGQLNESAPHYRESCVCDEANGIPFGRAVAHKATADGLAQVDLVASLSEAGNPYGVSGRNPVLDANSSTYADGEGMNVVRFGIVTVKPEDAVTKGSNPYVRATAGATLTALGRFRSDDGDEGAGALAALWKGAEFLASGAADEAVPMWVYDPNAEKEQVLVTMDIPDISSADEVYAASPVAGRVVAVYSCIDTAISVADATLTPKIGGTAIDGGEITVAQSGSAAGDVDSATPTDANVVTAGATLSVETDGGSTTASLCRVTFVIEKD